MDENRSQLYWLNDFTDAADPKRREISPLGSVKAGHRPPTNDCRTVDLLHADVRPSARWGRRWAGPLVPLGGRGICAPRLRAAHAVIAISFRYWHVRAISFNRCRREAHQEASRPPPIRKKLPYPLFYPLLKAHLFALHLHVIVRRACSSMRHASCVMRILVGLLPLRPGHTQQPNV